MFDVFSVDDCDGQVKMYNRTMQTFKIGDTVCSRKDNYSIKLRYGMWVNILGGVWDSYTESPLSDKCFDKWGHPWLWDCPRYE